MNRLRRKLNHSSQFGATLACRESEARQGEAQPHLQRVQGRDNLEKPCVWRNLMAW